MEELFEMNSFSSTLSPKHLAVILTNACSLILIWMEYWHIIKHKEENKIELYMLSNYAFRHISEVEFFSLYGFFSFLYSRISNLWLLLENETIFSPLGNSSLKLILVNNLRFCLNGSAITSRLHLRAYNHQVYMFLQEKLTTFWQHH